MGASDHVKELKGAELRAHWRQVLADHRSSEMTAAAFCRVRGISTWKFSYWRKALSDEATGAQGSSFVELRTSSFATGVVIEAGRWRVRVEPGFDAATLLRTLEALASP